MDAIHFIHVFLPSPNSFQILSTSLMFQFKVLFYFQNELKTNNNSKTNKNNRKGKHRYKNIESIFCWTQTPEHGHWHVHWYTVTPLKNWLSISLQVSIANVLLVRGENLSLLPFFMFRFCMLWACSFLVIAITDSGVHMCIALLCLEDITFLESFTAHLWLLQPFCPFFILDYWALKLRVW